MYSQVNFCLKNVCGNFYLWELILRIAGKSQKFRAIRPAHGIIVTLTNTPGWYLWTLVNTATKSNTEAYPIGGQRSIKIGIPKGMVFGPFWSENGFTLCPFWSGIGYDFGRIYRSVWHICHFKSKWLRKKEKYANWKIMHLKNFLFALQSKYWWNNFCLKARPETGMDFRGQVWKRVWKMTFFGLK